MDNQSVQFDEKTLTEIQNAAYNMGIDHAIKVSENFFGIRAYTTGEGLISKLEALKKTN